MAALERGWGEWGAGRAAPRSALRGQESGAAPLLLLRRGGGPRRKHKMEAEAEEEGCPAGKKRLREREASSGACGAAAAAGPPWLLSAGQPVRGESGPAVPGPGSPPPAPDSPCEDMEQAAGDQQCEAARRKLREIEDRITDEDEDEDGLEEEPLGTLPTLILSDTLKTGLRRDYTGDLTKKIIESMSRPSMELVVWKPLPEFLTKKTKSVSDKNYKPMADRCLTKPATLEAAFSLQTGQFSEPQQTERPSAFYCTVEPSGCSEEEMEL